MTSIPAVLLDLTFSDLSSATSSALSSQALSSMIVGMALSADAKEPMARDFFPGVALVSSSTWWDMRISGHPPNITQLSATVYCNTHSASCNDLSASSSTCLLKFIHQKNCKKQNNIMLFKVLWDKFITRQHSGQLLFIHFP